MEGKEIVYIVGTKKGAGKTTVLNRILRDCEGCCVTSVGMDGEEKDSLTGEPKPRVRVNTAQFVLTGERFLDLSRFEVLEVFSYNPIAGCETLARPLIETDVIVAGTSGSTIRQLSQNFHFARIIVDGALDRLVHAGVVDGAKIFLVVHGEGADSLRILRKVLFASKLAKPPNEVEIIVKDLEGVWAITKSGQLVKISDSCLTLRQTNYDEFEWLYVSGIVTTSVLRLKDKLNLCLNNPLAVAEVPDSFDNIYTVNKVALEKVFINSSSQRGLSTTLRRLLKGSSIEIEDVLTLD